MIKLKNSGALVSLEGVRLVKKMATVLSGVAYRYIEITYVDGGVVEIGYGRDSHNRNYDTYNPKLDEDYRQIEEELLGE
jgi:hypothetical protein